MNHNDERISIKEVEFFLKRLKIKKQLYIFVLKNIYRGNVYDFIRKKTMFINVNFNKVVFAFKFKPRLNLMFDPKDNLRVYVQSRIQ